MHRIREHCAPVRSAVAAPEFTNTLFFSFVTAAMASATEEVGTSSTISTPSRSYHLRAIFAPISGLFWWSA